MFLMMTTFHYPMRYLLCTLAVEIIGEGLIRVGIHHLKGKKCLDGVVIFRLG